MSEADWPEMPCPRCGGACERIAPALWQCEACGRIWDARHIEENDAEESE